MIHIITLGFAKPEMLKLSLKKLAEEIYYTNNCDGGDDILCYYLEQYYPLNDESKINECYGVAFGYGFKVFDAGKNLGLHHGFNYVLGKIDLRPEDLVIAYDADSYPKDLGWIMAMSNLIKIYPTIGWVTLMNPRSREELDRYGYDTLMFGNYRSIQFTKKDIVNSTCGFRGSFLIKSGGLTENRPFYGHLESPMWAKLQEQGLRWAFLADYWETDFLRDMHDRDYIVYKWEHAHKKSFDGDFASWLLAGKPTAEDAPEKLP